MDRKTVDEILELDDYRGNVFELFASAIEEVKVSKLKIPGIQVLYENLMEAVLNVELVLQDARNVRGARMDEPFLMELEYILALWFQIIKDRLSDIKVANQLLKKLQAMSLLVRLRMLDSQATLDYAHVIALEFEIFSPSLPHFVDSVLNEIRKGEKWLFSSEHLMVINSLIEINNTESIAKLIRQVSLRFKDRSAVLSGVEGNVKEVLLAEFLESGTVLGKVGSLQSGNYKQLDSPDLVKEVVGAGSPTSKKQNYVWDIYLSTHSKDAGKISYLLWCISSGISIIDGVAVELVDWGKGSFWMRLKISMSGWIAKEEVKQVIKKSVKTVHARSQALQGSIPDSAAFDIEKPLEQMDLLSDKKRQNELQQLLLEEKFETVRALKLENELREAELRSKKLDLIQKASELMSNAMIEMDSDFQMAVNDILVIKKTASGGVEVGETNKMDSEDRALEGG